MNSIALGTIIVTFFIWRFIRTRQIYLNSLKMRALGLKPIVFNLRDPRSFVQQVLLGRRSIEPSSFFIRAFIFALVAFCLFPFKNYDPNLYWLVIAMILFYILWCITHGVMLKKKYLTMENSNHFADNDKNL